MTSVDLTKTNTGTVLQGETSETGSLEGKVYLVYWKAIGYVFTVFIAISLISMQASRNATDLWLSVWVSKSTGNVAPNVTFYLTIYIIIASANTIFTLFRAFLFAYGGIQAAKRIHQDLLSVVMWVSIAAYLSH